jgi:hypothetical protein
LSACLSAGGLFLVRAGIGGDIAGFLAAQRDLNILRLGGGFLPFTVLCLSAPCYDYNRKKLTGFTGQLFLLYI